MTRLAAIAFLIAVLAGPARSSGADDELTIFKAKHLISTAAGMPAKELKELAESPNLPPDFKPSNGFSLTWAILSYNPKDAPKNPTSFRFLDELPSPAQLAGAISGPKDREGNFRPIATIIHPEYITDCTAKVDGTTATGTVTFKAEKAYEGKIEYTARKKDGTWRIEEFRLPDLKMTLVLGADGKWIQKK
jgi:hypothetical protein